MLSVVDNSAFNRYLEENKMVFAYFSGPNCSVCHVMKPKIETLLSKNFTDVIVIEIKSEKLPDLAARFSIFAVPAILFFIEGREYIREVRIIDLTILYQKLEKIIKLYKA